MCDQQMLKPACAYAQSDQSLCLLLEYSTNRTAFEVFKLTILGNKHIHMYLVLSHYVENNKKPMMAMKAKIIKNS